MNISIVHYTKSSNVSALLGSTGSSSFGANRGFLLDT